MKRRSRRNKDKKQLYKGIILVVLGLLLILWTLSSNSEDFVNDDDKFCHDSCKNICESKETNLTDYLYRGEGCDCECSDRTKVIFGIDLKN